MTLTTLLGELLQLDPAQITDDVSRTTHGQWSSYKHVQLLITVEDLYGISFTSQEMAAIITVGQLRAALAEKGVLTGPEGAP